MIKPIFLTVLCCLIFAQSQYADDASASSEFDPAFTHVVYFWLKNPESADDRQQFELAVKKFMHDSKFAKTRFIGVPPLATRDVVDDSFTYALILSFESAAAQEQYQAEPAHQEFVAECKELWSKVIVYDAIPLTGQE